MDSSQLGTFLNFGSGTSYALMLYILYLQSYTQRPIAHICGCVLELQGTYDTYAKFRTEFTNILAETRQLPETHKQTTIKLPFLQLKKFGGNPTEWKAFLDAFASAIDNNTD